MQIIQPIKNSTCRVDSGENQLGSAFWVNNNQLLTAAHVVEAAQATTFNLRTANGEEFEAEVVSKHGGVNRNDGPDIAVLEADTNPDDYTELSIDTSAPSIGTQVVWSGYARLFGESQINRQRFGWGRVASNPYGGSNSTFFEVDGLFNPSHSGGPVVETQTHQVVGVVSASAGGFEELEEEWTERIGMLQELFKLQQGQGMLYRTFTYEKPENAVNDKAIFERMGLNVDSDTNADGNMQLKINTEEIPIAAGKLQAELAKLLLDTAQATFQMGVGIASGGDALKEVL